MLYLEEIDRYITKITAEQFLKWIEYEYSDLDDWDKKALMINSIVLDIDINEVNLWDIDSMYIKLLLEIVEIKELIGKVVKDGFGLEEVKKEKSFFDEYDEENGYITKEEKEESNEYEVYKKVINCFSRFMSDNHRMDYKSFMETDIRLLLSNIEYNAKLDREQAKERGNS